MLFGEALAVRGLHVGLESRRNVACCKSLAFSEARCGHWPRLLDAVAPQAWKGRVRCGRRAKRFALSMLTGLRRLPGRAPRRPHPLFPAYLCSRCAGTGTVEVCSRLRGPAGQLAHEPPLLGALDHALACLPAAYPSMNLRLCFVDIGTRFPVRGQGGDPGRTLRFCFSEDVTLPLVRAGAGGGAGRRPAAR